MEGVGGGVGLASGGWWMEGSFFFPVAGASGSGGWMDGEGWMERAGRAGGFTVLGGWRLTLEGGLYGGGLDGGGSMDGGMG